MSSLTGTRSAAGSNVSFCRLALIASAMVVTSSVWPSGGDLATAALPIMLPPPGRLFTTTVADQLSVKRCAIMRAMMSLVPPATNGTTISIGLVGYT